MIDLSVHIERMEIHIEADELVRGLGFAAAFAQATKRGGPAKSAPLDAVPCTAYLNWLLGFPRPRNARQRNRILCIVARFCKFWSATYDAVARAREQGRNDALACQIDRRQKSSFKR